MTDNHTPVAPHDCISGLVYTHNRANANTGELHRACATAHAVTELLIERGLLDRENCGCTVYQQRPIDPLPRLRLPPGRAHLAGLRE